MITNAATSLAPIEQALKQRNFAHAVTLAEAVVRAAPNRHEAWRLLGAALSGCGRPADAVVAIRRALSGRPDDPKMHNSLGAALHASGDQEGAQAAFRKAVEVDPDFTPGWQNLTIALMSAEDDDGASLAIERLLALQPKLLRARIMRGDILRNTRPGEEVAAEYRRIIADHPESGWAWYGLSNLKNVPLSSADTVQMQRLYTAPGKDEQERAALGFALAKALEDNARYVEAFATLIEANTSMRSRIPWDAAAFSAGIDAVLATFSKPHATALEQGGYAIFIVSLPRSGSTLVEQILASHSCVYGGGEYLHLEAVIGEENRRRGCSLAEWTKTADAADWQRLGVDYLRRVERAMGAQRGLFTDKSPDNWKYLGAVLAMLPQARIINCRRDPVETGLSCFKQLFPATNQAFSYSLADIGAFWHDYDRACRHWQPLFPDRFYDLRYEDVQADPEAAIRKLLKFCGLEFEPACLAFHKTERKVNTISSAQVREPLRRDTARAANYGASLDPLRVALGLPPFRPG